MHPKYVSLASFLLLGACGVQIQNSSHVQIIDGHDANGSLHPVVSLQKEDSQGVMFSYCTGVLISPNHVLTAAHCSTESQSTPVVPVASKTRSVVAYDSHPERPSAQRIPVARINLAPGYDPLQMQRNAEGLIIPANAQDIAVWTLAEPAPTGPLATAITTEETDLFLVNGKQVVIMGFGKRSIWDSPWIEHSLATAETPFFETVEMTQVKQGFENGRLVKKNIKHTIKGRTESEFFAGGKDLPDTCNGDSGGPAFIKQGDGRLLLIGITSRGAVSCDQGGVYTLVPAFMPWVKTITKSLETTGN